MQGPKSGDVKSRRLPSTRQSALPVLGLILLWAALYVYGLGTPDIDSQMEALRGIVARNMIATGDWVVPIYRGGVYLAKPPLMYWAIAVFSLPTDAVTVWTLRLPSAVATLGVAVLIVLWCRRRGWIEVGWYSAFLFLCLPLVLEKGMRGEIQMLLTLCTCGALMAFFEGNDIAQSTRARWLWIWVAYVLVGLGVLAKGPPVMVVVFGTWLGYCVLQRWRNSLPGAHAVGFLLSCVIVMSWAWPLIQSVGWDSALRSLRLEAVDRIVTAPPGNEEPFYFYVVSLALAALPAVVMIPFVRLQQFGNAALPSMRFLICWVVIPLVLFSLAAHKESRYLLPIYPAMAILGGLGMFQLRRRLEQRFRTAKVPPALTFTIVIVSLVAPVMVIAQHQLYQSNMLWGVLWAALWIAAGVAAVFFLRQRQLKVAALFLLGWLLVLKGFYMTAFVPERNERRSARHIGATINETMPQGQLLYMLNASRAAIDYYIENPIREINNVKSLHRTEQRSRAQYLLYDQEAVSGQDELYLQRNFEILDQRTFHVKGKSYVFKVVAPLAKPDNDGSAS